MNKKKGLSLIETLISLTILGVSLLALLPVVTVKQQTLSPASSNNNFKKVEKTDNALSPEYYFVADRMVNIGELDINFNPRNNLTVNALGFAYQNTPALYITDRLYFNTNKIVKVDNNGASGIQIASGNPFKDNERKYRTDNAEPVLYYPINAYIDNTSVILNNSISNNNITDNQFIPKLKNTNPTPQWIISKQFGDATNPFGNDNVYSTNLATTRLYSISAQDNANVPNEYIHFSENNITDYDNNGFFYHIGIGKNSVSEYRANRNFTGIYNRTVAMDKIGLPYNLNLGIGMLPNAGITWQSPDTFVISHNTAPLETPFTFNANVVMNNGTTLTTNSITLASDKRLKTILGKYTGSLKEILKIHPVTYTYKSDKDKNTHVGVIAQSLRKIIPEAVSVNPTNGYLLVSTDGIFYALLNSIKELNNKNLELKKQNDELENKIKELRKIAGGKHEYQ